MNASNGVKMGIGEVISTDVSKNKSLGVLEENLLFQRKKYNKLKQHFSDISRFCIKYDDEFSSKIDSTHLLTSKYNEIVKSRKFFFSSNNINDFESFKKRMEGVTIFKENYFSKISHFVETIFKQYFRHFENHNSYSLEFLEKINRLVKSYSDKKESWMNYEISISLLLERIEKLFFSQNIFFRDMKGVIAMKNKNKKNIKYINMIKRNEKEINAFFIELENTFKLYQDYFNFLVALKGRIESLVTNFTNTTINELKDIPYVLKFSFAIKEYSSIVEKEIESRDMFNKQLNSALKEKYKICESDQSEIRRIIFEPLNNYNKDINDDIFKYSYYDHVDTESNSESTTPSIIVDGNDVSNISIRHIDIEKRKDKCISIGVQTCDECISSSSSSSSSSSNVVNNSEIAKVYEENEMLKRKIENITNSENIMIIQLKRKLKKQGKTIEKLKKRKKRNFDGNLENIKKSLMFNKIKYQNIKKGDRVLCIKDWKRGFWKVLKEENEKEYVLCLSNSYSINQMNENSSSILYATIVNIEKKIAQNLDNAFNFEVGQEYFELFVRNVEFPSSGKCVCMV